MVPCSQITNTRNRKGWCVSVDFIFFSNKNHIFNANYTPTLAPGFQTNVRRIRVTPEIAARIQRGEQVSPEEIEAASEKANEEEATSKSPSKETYSNAGVNTLPMRIIEERDDRDITSQKRKEDPVENEWLPDSVTGPKKRGKGKKR